MQLLGRNRTRPQGTRRPGVFSPANLPSAFAGFDATNLATSGAAITTLYDQATLLGAQDMVQADGTRQFNLSAADSNFNGRPSIINSTGTNNNASMAASTVADWNVLHNGTGMSIYGVIKTGQNLDYLLSTDNGGANRGVELTLSAGSLAFRIYSPSAVIVLSATISLGAVHQFIIKHKTGGVGADAHMRIDKAASASANNTAAPSALAATIPLVFGNYRNLGDQGWRGRVACLWFFNTEITAAEEAILEAYGTSVFGAP
jgi:hypothetical protein